MGVEPETIAGYPCTTGKGCLWRDRPVRPVHRAEADQAVTRHVIAFRDAGEVPSAAAKRAMAQEVQPVLDQPR